jgi:eukaryotic-like serine/threonine-protein kinase
MPGCPSRQQLLSVIAGRASAAEQVDIEAHARRCPKCRELLMAPAREEVAASGRRAIDRGSTVPATVREPSDSPATWRDASGTVDPIASESSAGDTVDLPASAADGVEATWEEQAATLDRIFGDPPAEADTVDTCAPLVESLAKTELGAPARRSSSGFTRTLDAHADTSNLVPGAADQTSDFSADQRPEARKTLPGLPGSFAVPGQGGEAGPAGYEILGELGRGGMGIVYKALDRRLNRLVALKMIRGGVHADDIQIVRFKIEAEAVAALRHTNILQIYEIGDCGGLPYVALELLDGGSLAHRLRGTALAPKQAAQWMVPLALAMDTAHRAGIVHRDLKSANILFTADGIPKITDFGLAKRLEDDEGQTHTGQVLGTPSYMAPEQARGDTKSVGPAADIYALGAMLYEMLTGRPPFKGISAMETVKQVIEFEPVAPSRVQYRVPRDLETICLKCLQKEPRKRYATAKEVADDLSRYLVREPIKARRTPAIERGIKWARRRPARATFLAFTFLGVAGLASFSAWYWNRQRTLERTTAAHLALVQEETAKDLVHAQQALSGNDFNKAEVVLTARDSVLMREGSRRLANLREQTRNMLADVQKAQDAARARVVAQEARDAVQQRYRRFLDRRKAALFRDTQFAGLMLPANPDLTRQSALLALAVFAHRKGEDGWVLGELPAALAAEQQDEVKDGCYELLLVLADATAKMGDGQIDRALRVLESADQLRPGHSRAYHLKKASLLAQKGDRSGEANELSSAARSAQETAFDYFLTGQQEFKQQRWPEAIRNFEIALRKNPDHFWAHCMSANCFLRTSRPDAAKSSLYSCIQADPNHALLYFLRGLASGQIGIKYHTLVKSSPGLEAQLIAAAAFEFDEAEADFREALAKVERTPDLELNYELFVNRAFFRVQRGSLDLAAADYQKAIALKDDLYLAHADLAGVYQKQGKMDLALEQFTRAIALRPDFAPLYRARADLRGSLGLSTPAERAAVRADLETAIRYEQPGNTVLAQDHTNRGKLLYADDRLTDALEESKLALSILPNFEDAHVLQIQVLLKSMNYDEALHACDVALAAGKKSAFLHQLRGLAHAGRHDYREAIRDYGVALEARGDDGKVLSLRGWAYLVYESPKLALADFEAAIKLDSADGEAYSGRGTARVRMGDPLGAVADARAALKRAGADPRVMYNAARIYALAASSPAAALGGNGREAGLPVARYRDTAVDLIRSALERQPPEKRAAFWRDTIEPDPALRTIMRRLKFEEGVATIKQPSS